MSGLSILSDSDTIHWVPNESILNDVICLLREADSSDSNVQRRLTEALSRLEALVDAPCYFCFILVDRDKESKDVRQRAGLLLKNRIADLVKKASEQRAGLDGTHRSTISVADATVMNYVKKNAIRALCDKVRVVRETAGTVLAAIVGCQGVQQFPEVLPSLYQLLDHPDIEIVGGAFSALDKIIEDELERGELSIAPVNAENLAGKVFPEFCTHKLLPKLLQLASPQTPLLQRRHSLLCLNHFLAANLFSPTETFAQFFQPYWTCLGILALDHTSEIRLAVLQGMVHLALMTPHILVNSLVSLIPFILNCLSLNQPYEIRFEALELLSHLLNHASAHAMMEESLPQ